MDISSQNVQRIVNRYGQHRWRPHARQDRVSSSVHGSPSNRYWMILTLRCLGSEYIVWDKAAEIEFVAPGRTDVFAEFRIDDAMLDEIRAATAGGEKYLRWCETEIRSGDGELVARVRKQLYVRRKKFGS